MLYWCIHPFILAMFGALSYVSVCVGMCRPVIIIICMLRELEMFSTFLLCSEKEFLDLFLALFYRHCCLHGYLGQPLDVVSTDNSKSNCPSKFELCSSIESTKSCLLFISFFQRILLFFQELKFQFQQINFR